MSTEAEKKPEFESTDTGARRSKIYARGKHFDARYDLLMRNAAGLRRLAEAFGEGIEKGYGEDNWMNGFKESVYVNHMLEHLRLYLAGDTSEDHIGHLAWNAMALMWTEENKPELMDLTKIKQVV